MTRTICVEAPAKINLHLGVSTDVVAKRHQLDTILHTLSLSDTLVLEAESDASCPGISLVTTYADGIPPCDIAFDDNLVVKAARMLSSSIGRQLSLTGHPLSERLSFSLTKRIPVQGGLGGGSSDCAAALLALATLWDIDVCGPESRAVAAALGSDVSFFLYGGCAHMNGTGERLARKLSPLECPVVLVRPACGVSTGAAYRAFDADPQPAGEIDALIEALDAPSVDLRRLAQASCNNLAPAAYALLPELEHLVSWLRSLPGVFLALLAGSGSTVFGLCESWQAAEDAASEARARGLWSCACTTTHEGVVVRSDESV